MASDSLPATHFQDPLGTLSCLDEKKKYYYYSLKLLEKKLAYPIARLPVSLRLILESILRNYDGNKITDKDLHLDLKDHERNKSKELPFVVSRVVLQDFTGVPLLVDLAAMRDAVAKQGKSPDLIEPLVPVDLVVDHSVQVDHFGGQKAFEDNLDMEFQRNRERYEFLKWGQEAFETFKVIPPGVGIVHQINLEYLAKVVWKEKKEDAFILYPDTLVGTDSHTTMINGLGVVGWGVGGIEAEAAMLGQPVFVPMPEVVGVELTGKMKEGVTATDLTLTLTQLLRKENVVGKFVEFYGQGTESLTVADRATIANMAPEYGATMGFFPTDEKTLEYLALTGREEDDIADVRRYLQAQGLFGIPKKGELDYSKNLELDLGTVQPCVSGPKRPQDRIVLEDLKEKYQELLHASVRDGGYALKKGEPRAKVNVRGMDLSHGSILIAAITSCTNTSNPGVMLAAGLVAKKAVERGLCVNPVIKTSLAPGSRVVTDYLDKTGLQPYLDQLGFHLVAYGCTTCIGNSGPLEEDLEKAIDEHELVTASVLSGNRNFEARIHGSIKANFLMSPPLVVAFALAGRIDIDLSCEPIAQDKDGKPVYLKDLWPSSAEVQALQAKALDPQTFQKRYSQLDDVVPAWQNISSVKENLYRWDENSTYIQAPPFFDQFTIKLGEKESFQKMKALALFGDSVTTDHISPAGRFLSNTPAGSYLLSKDIKEKDFNSYGSRRGNDRIMTRGTFANVRVRNLILDGKEGGFTKLMPEGKEMSIFDACMEYKKRQVPLIVFAGKDYGMGSSRDWAAKGSALLGVKVVVAESFERIHRSNLIGMGVLPLQFKEGDSHQSLGIQGDESFELLGADGELKAGQELCLSIQKENAETRQVQLLCRLDTAIEVDYYCHGGILPYVLRDLLHKASV